MAGKDYAVGVQPGTYCNGTALGDGTITSTTNAFSSTAATFVVGDVGKSIVVAGAGAAGALLATTISAFTDSHHVSLTATASTSVSGVRYAYGSAPLKPCSPTTGATNLIDATLYNWGGDPAGFGCGATSAFSFASNQVTCLGNQATVIINGVDFAPNNSGTITCASFTSSPSTTVNSFTLQNFRWKMDSGLGTNGVNGCSHPAAGTGGNEIIFNYAAQSTTILVQYAWMDQQANQSYMQTNGLNGSGVATGGNSQIVLIDFLTQGSYRQQYTYCANVVARCASGRIGTAFYYDYNVGPGGGYYPGMPHYESSLPYPILGYNVSQEIINNTLWQNASVNSPAATSAISTSESANNAISTAVYDNAGTLTLTFGSAPYGTAPQVGNYVYPFGMTGTNIASINSTWWPIASSSGSGTTIVLTVTPSLSVGAITGGNAWINNWTTLTMRLNTVVSNLIGGVSPYWAAGETAPVVGGSQTGTYAVGDIVSHSGTGCTGGAQSLATFLVTTVSAGAVTNAVPQDGGHCTSRPVGAFATTCVSGTCIGSSGAGLTLNSIYQQATVGYGIQPGTAAYSGAVNISNNAIDTTGTAIQGVPSVDAIFYQQTKCAGSSTFANNFYLQDGSAITASGSGYSGCLVGP
jgi:hypothetical protein